jgi:hypothetical protein
MEQTNNLKYLKGVTIILLVVYTLFVLMNFLHGIWDLVFHFGNGELNFLIHIKNYTGGFHFVLYVLTHVLEICFMLVLNRFVKINGIGKGYRFLIILLSFVPVANCFLFYIIKRKLNKELFTYSGMNGVGSDRKIIATWVLMIVFVVYTFLIPLLTYYLNSPELVSEAASFMSFSRLITDGYFLASSFIYLFYYMEFKRMLDKVDLMHTQINDNVLLDS